LLPSWRHSGDKMGDLESVTVRRSSPMSRRESGNFSRRNSHCSIIQTNDNVCLLVQCRTDLGSDSGSDHRKSIDIVTIDYDNINTVSSANDDKNNRPSSTSSSSNSSFCSLDLDQNILQMEETQRRINVTLENLLKLRHHHHHSNQTDVNLRQQHLSNVNIRHSTSVNNIKPPHRNDVNSCKVLSADLDSLGRQQGTFLLSRGVIASDNSATRKRHSLKDNTSKESKESHLLSSNCIKRESNSLQVNKNIFQVAKLEEIETNGNCIRNSNNQNNNSCRNSNQFSIDGSPVKNKIQGLINSVKILKNRNSVEKEVAEKNIISRDRKITRTKETFSVEDFTELIKGLPANHFPEKQSIDVLNQPKSKNILFHIANELMTSELDYVANLKLICEDFPKFIIESSHQVAHLSINNFSNLPQIYNLSQDLSQEFQFRINSWDQHGKIADIFLRHASHFNIYLPYLENFSNMNKHFDDCCSNNPQYRNICISFEKLPECRNLKIKHFLLKPVQRFPQYKLLLQDYLKHLDKDAEDYEDTVNALKIVTDLLKNANDAIL